MKNYTIRTEQPCDFKAIENLTREAFWNVYRPGCTEHYVLHCYRESPDFAHPGSRQRNRRTRDVRMVAHRRR